MMTLAAAAAEPVGQLISSIGAGDFAASFHAFAMRRFGVNRCHVFSFSQRARPTCVVLQSRSAWVSKAARTLATDYMGGDYHLDPLLKQLDPVDGLWIANDHPRGLRSGYFRGKYYEYSRIGDEISVLARVKGRLIYAGFCRQEDETPFTQQEFQSVCTEAPIVVSSVIRHLEVLDLQRTTSVPGGPDTAEERRRVFFGKVRDALLDSRQGLTSREAEICAYIAQGYFVSAIAQILGISPNTVCTYRKRAYRKLGISRQNELFTGYINLLS